LSPAQWDLMNTIRCSGETLLTLITDILDFSRIEADKMVLAPTEFHLQTVIEAAMEIAGLHAAQKRLQVYIYLFIYTYIVIYKHLRDVTPHAAVLHNANKDSLAQCCMLHGRACRYIYTYVCAPISAIRLGVRVKLLHASMPYRQLQQFGDQ